MEKLILIFFILSSGSFYSQKNALIIGNSLMFYNNLEKTLENMFEENNDSIKVDILAFGGYSLRNHLDNYHYGKNNKKSIDFVQFKRYKQLGYDIERIKKKYKIKLDLDTINKSTLELSLDNKKYDYIIIQEHGDMIASQILCQYVAKKSLERFVYILGKSKSNKAKIIYYTEYPSKYFYSQKDKNHIYEQKRVFYQVFYDTVTCYKMDKQDSVKYLKGKWKSLLSDSNLTGKNSKEDIEKYVNNIENLKDIYNITISPTAIIFDSVARMDYKTKMYSPGGHPSKNASFIFAAVFYRNITGKKLEKIPSKININKTRSQKLIKFINSFENL